MENDDLPNPKQVKAARALLAWTQADLAREAKVAVSTVADFERGQRNPVPNNAQAIRDALVAKGILFGGGGVVESGWALVSAAPAPGKPLRWIEARDLVQWAATREAQGKLPELVSRLILATCGPGARMRFPAGDSVQLSGWDGICETPVGATYIPTGKSVWELGTQRDRIAAKAEQDYAKRSANPLGVKQSGTTFIFLTPQPWPAKDEWAAQKRAENVWKDVQVIDADTLVHWLEQTPGVAEWLAVQMGRRPEGLRGIQEVWDEWSLATARPLTAELMAADRDKQVADVLKWLRDPPSMLSVQAEAVDEAMAFLAAAIDPLPDTHRVYWESRILVPQIDDVARLLVGVGPKLVIVLNQGDTGLAQKLVAEGHHVYVALGPDANPRGNAIVLERPWRHTVEKVLEAMGEDRHSAAALAKQSGRSLAVLRRLMPKGTAKPPTWAVAPVHPALLAALLAGGWVETNPHDRLVLERLSGLKYEEIEAALAPLAAKFDAPIRRSGAVWRLASLRDAWLLLASNLTPTQLDRHKTVFLEILGGSNPKFNSRDPDEFVLDHTGPKEVSSILRIGLGEAMIALAVHPERATAVRDAADRSARAVRKLLADADETIWWSLSSDFRRVAEAAPEAFLDALENALDADPSPLAPLFRSDEGYLHPREYLADLMWALETLCWSPQTLGSVTDILCRLAEMDPGGKVSNRPADTLRRIYLPWTPQTFATHAERMAALDMVLKRHPKVGWKLLMDISPTGHGVSTPSATPHWRDYSVENPERVTHRSLAIAYDEIGERVIAEAGTSAERWTTVLDHWDSFSPEWREKAYTALAAAAAAFTPSEKLAFRELIRQYVARHEAYPDAVWAVEDAELEPFRNLLVQLEPVAAVDKFAFLFDQGGYLIDSKLSYEERHKQFREDQRNAARKIVEESSVERVLELATAVDNPNSLGWAIGASISPENKKDALLEAALLSDDVAVQTFAGGLAGGVAESRGAAWLVQRFENADKTDGASPGLVTLAFALPLGRETWEKISAAGPALEKIYWSRLNILNIRSSEDPTYVCEKLLAAGRGRAALSWLGDHDDMAVNIDTVLAVLRHKSTTSPEGDQHPNDSAMMSYYAARVFKRLDEASSVPTDTIVHLEWVYFEVLEHSDRPAKNLHAALASDPAFYMTLMKALYLPADGGEDLLDGLNAEESRTVGSHAFQVLHEWRRVPGSDPDGKIDLEKLRAWVIEVRRLAAEACRVDIVDEKIGEILSAAIRAKGEIWPPEPVREIIETLRNRHLETGFEIGLYNRRGVTIRAPTDGGEQERDLADVYRRDAREIAITWPRTSRVLQRIAESYGHDAQREDASADINDW